MAKKKKDLRAPDRVAMAKVKGGGGGGRGGRGGGGMPRGPVRVPGGAAAKGHVTAKENVFERMWNRRKFDILGKKTKGEQRRVGKSRTDAVEKRKATLLPEYRQRNKNNKFLDYRFGENDENMMEDEKEIMRFQRERQAQLSRTSKFNLQDEDEEETGKEEEFLTHGGSVLSTFDDFDEEFPKDDDFHDPELDAAMVRDFHFGGPQFDEKKKMGNNEDGEEEQRPKTKKEAMEELIAKSKYFKAQNQKEKDEDEDFREKLDLEFRQLSESDALLSLLRPKKTNLLATLAKKGTNRDTGSQKLSTNGTMTAGNDEEDKDDYEKLAKEMVFEMRGKATNRSKTTEEMAKEERERLVELEKKRKRRMTGEDASDEEGEEGEEEGGGRRKRVKRREPSGDDLEDNVVVEEEYGEKGWVYDVLGRRDEEGEEEGEEEDEDEDEDEDESGEEEEEGEEGGEGEEGDEDEEESEEEEGGGRDLEEADWEQSDEELEGGKGEEKKIETRQESKNSVPEEGVGEREKGDRKIGKKVSWKEEAQVDGKEREEREKAAKELPYVLEAPQTLMELRNIVDNREIAELSEAIRRIRTFNAVGLAAENRRKMQVFYGVLVQYFAFLAGENPLPFDRLDSLVQPLIEMSTLTPIFSAVCARERISRMHQQLTAKLKAADQISVFPSVRTLLLLRLWTIIFPTSDFRHPVITPIFLLISEYLSRCPVKSLRDAAIGCFLCAQILTMASQGRRFCPEAIFFLHALLRTALPEKKKEGKKLPFQGVPLYMEEQVGSQHWLFPEETKEYGNKVELLDFCETMTTKDETDLNSDEFRFGLLMSLLSTLHGFVVIYENLTSFPEIFSSFLTTLDNLSQVSLPGDLEALREKLSGSIKKKILEVENLRQPMRMRVKRPEPIKQFNPRFEENFISGRNYDPDKERADRKKMQKLLKREARGAARELRKDNYFLAEERRKEQLMASEERDEKYRKAMAFLQGQESAFKSGQMGNKKGRRNKR